MDISKHLINSELDTSDKRPLYMQIAFLIADKIQKQTLPPGIKLPSERELADLFGVSRTTAINAYRQLEQQGLVWTKVGSGTYVSPVRHVESQPEVPWLQLFTPYPQDPLASTLRDLVATPASNTISLAAGLPDPALYPLETFTELFNYHIDRVSPADFGYIPVEGYHPFRKSVAAMLNEKGIAASAENILALSGSQQGLYLVSKILLAPGDYVVTETPTFIGAIQVFQAAGARILSLPCRQNLELLEDYLIRYRPKLLYIIPTYQNPSGRVLPAHERQDLIKLAKRHRLIILEDDPYSELSYDTQPPPALKALDHYEGLIYLGTFSKILCPGLRTGYLVGPPVLINRLALEKQFIDLHSNNLAQWLVTMFLSEGMLAQHLATVRREYKRRRDAMAKALQRLCAGEIEFAVPEGGFFFWCKLKQAGTSQQLLQEAVNNRISFVPGEVFQTVPTNQDKEFRLCFAAHNEAILLEAIQRLAKTLSQIRKKHLSTASPPCSVRPII
ncbi:PLP-dependent aminotransferase family protein [Desulforamulus hydrothermalis]|uniref:Bacterial regulatory s, gntR family protein n=1 Tax=Desulforamulus hydrothermalis Lam5 = DSM 18033 TaxID=1121428 RepID=K8E8U7_9FIRM|nr:PLP-dependent aminotransferase family protein [Desulforamulus hydrothermalis]CCO07933.1 Bacterial regulatory s, gntR family protein [Desulforamulus hydrothermalis Lam5 = DSM 18033]SHG85939.1 DNA-binding transcriptional regulator, MocR family, contains an aminotransferase domain [Desulforamulus hydrothermalis Lam5 = DSM 18033]